MKEITTPSKSLTLTDSKFGQTITDNETHISYAERNSSERPMFNMLVKIFNEGINR